MAPKDPRSVPLLNTIVTELSVGVGEACERKNSVPNLRFISCRILTDLGEVLPADVKSTALAKMKELVKDEDRDVRSFATKGVQKLSSL